MKTENPFGEMTAEEKKNMIIERQLQMLDAFHARHAISEEDYKHGVKYLQSQESSPELQFLLLSFSCLTF